MKRVNTEQTYNKHGWLYSTHLLKDDVDIALWCFISNNLIKIVNDNLVVLSGQTAL